jgi:predicted nucleotide-binding protein (sugar kinase/HSP70/actin superfamily)
MEKEKARVFRSLSEKVGQFSLQNKTFLIPEMNRIGAHLLAGVFRSFGVNALVMETYEGLSLGKEFTSGKECFPCQVTTGDILYFLQQEKERLGGSFRPENYVFFMPEANGPCRFGMYNKYQRIVLDSLPGLEDVKIGSLTSKDSYALKGMLEKERARDFRKAAYFSVVVGDVLDRLLWRIRPYEKEPGAADRFIEEAMQTMAGSFESYGAKRAFGKILERLIAVVRAGRRLIDPKLPSKPLIGIVGEIYLRSHVQANQDVIRIIERYGGEVVNTSIAEWVDYTTYDNVRQARNELRSQFRLFRLNGLRSSLKQLLGQGADLFYQQMRHDQVYRRVQRFIDLAPDHRISHLEGLLLKDDLYSFDVGTEACLSIAGIMEYIHQGYNGVVNVYPFTCMPGTITSSVVRPIMNQVKMPFLDAPYDGTYQPGREAAIRTFMYQAQQHFQRTGRGARH